MILIIKIIYIVYIFFSLGPTLKLRRPIVSKMFKDKIDAFYEEA